MKAKKLIFTFILFGIVGFTAGSFKKSHDKTTEIQTVLEEHCDCEKIEKTMYAKGIQYSNNDGFTTEKVEFQLTNCNYSNFNIERFRIAQHLKDEVGKFETFNQVTLDFVSADKHQKVVINNGKIQ